MTKTVQVNELAATLIGRWEETGRKLMTLAEDFPESKYGFKPADEVRTVAGVLRHVAFWNQYVADSVLGRRADEASNELPEKEYSTKASIVDALERSMASAAVALRKRESAIDPKMAEMVVTFIEHASEHYGQLVVYARLNGIVPPASREQGR